MELLKYLWNLGVEGKLIRLTDIFIKPFGRMVLTYLNGYKRKLET